MPTIKDIAREAGVSHGTVSNVLNKTGKVSVEKIKLVEAAAKKLGYTYNLQARLLRQGVKNHIAIVLPTMLMDCYRDLYDSLNRALFHEGFDVMLYTTEDIPSHEERVLDRIPLSSTSLIIAISCSSRAFMNIDLPCPVILVNRPVKNKFNETSFISFDFKKAGSDIANYIKINKYKKVAFFSGVHDIEDNILFMEGLNKGLENSGVSIQHFSSDIGLAMNKAFSIVRNIQNFDIVVTSNRLRAEAIATAARFLKLDREPAIITIAPYKAFSDSRYITYELDYKYMGSVIAQKALTYIREGETIKGDIILDNTGFRFKFPNIKRRPNRSLSLLTLLSPLSSALQKLASSFYDLTGISLDITALSYGDLYSHINRLNGSFNHDLIRMDVAWFIDKAREVYRPLDSKALPRDIYKNLFMDSHHFYTQVDDIPYALPFDPSVQILLYRKDLFEDATLQRAYYEMYKEPLKVPKNFSQYNKVAKFFTRAENPLSPVEYGTATTSGSAQVAACDFLPRMLYELRKAKAGKLISLRSRPVLRALKGYLDLLSYTDPQSNIWWADSIQHFSEGNCAMLITFSNHAPQIIDSKHSSIVGQVGASVVPGGTPLLGGGIVGISKHTQKMEECYQFFNWYYNSEVASLVATLGGSSPHINVFNDIEIITQFPWLETTKESFKLGVRNYNEFFDYEMNIEEIEYIIGIAVLRAMDSTVSARDALDYAQRLHEGMTRKTM